MLNTFIGIPIFSYPPEKDIQAGMYDKWIENIRNNKNVMINFNFLNFQRLCYLEELQKKRRAALNPQDNYVDSMTDTTGLEGLTYQFEEVWQKNQEQIRKKYENLDIMQSQRKIREEQLKIMIEKIKTYKGNEKFNESVRQQAIESIIIMEIVDWYDFVTKEELW